MRAYLRGYESWGPHDDGIPRDLSPLLDRWGLEVVSWPLGGRLREAIIDGVIAIDEGVCDRWRRWLIAHAVGHHVLHAGASFYLASSQWVSRVKAERQAEEFAAGLLAPTAAFARRDAHELAARLGLPASKMAFAVPFWRSGP